MRKAILALSTLFICTNVIAQTCPTRGAVNYQRWNNISGGDVINLTSNPSFPNNPSVTGTQSSFEMPTNQGNNIGIRMYGWICPPTTGNYVFWIASDNAGELWLSSTIDPANKTRIAYNTRGTNSRKWNSFPTQKSISIPLTAGNKYYIEALMKENSGNDNLAVGWAKPGQSTSQPSEVIPGSCLSVNNVTVVDVPTAPANPTARNITGTSFTLSWSPSTSNTSTIAGYDIYRNGVKINSATMAGTSYSVTGCSPNTMYAMTIKAKDATGTESVASATLNVSTLPVTTASEVFSVRTIIGNQRMPHDLVYGTDNNIWYTERFGGTVSFINPDTRVKRTVLTLGTKMVRAGGQDGLMGLALHPLFLQGKPYVYISYTYQSLSSTVRRIRIERYTYDFNTQLLGSPVTIMENIPGSNDHNSARLAIGPDNKLYYSAGDMGAGQFDNISRVNNSQNLNIYEGKILRLNTEAESGNWIPSDNPFLNNGVPTAVYTSGHRNPQGLVWGNVNGTDLLYSSEHGPFSDDELNVIERGRNYGWPQVAGYCDGNYNGRTVGGFAIVNEQNNCNTLNAREPLRSVFPSSNPPTGGDNMTWPSMAPSGTDFYGSTAIPGWQNSLLVAMLKSGTITRYKLSNDGLMIISDTINYFRGLGRFRDVVVSPDGLKIYVACDSSGSTSGPTGSVTTTPANPGSILEFTFSQSVVPGWVNNEMRELNEMPKKSRMDIYPNPANEFVVLYNYSTGVKQVVMYDMSGRTVRKQVMTGGALRIETKDLRAGVYIVNVFDEASKDMRSEKIVVRH